LPAAPISSPSPPSCWAGPRVCRRSGPEDRLPLPAGRRLCLLRAAIRDDDPVVYLEHKRLYSNEGALAATVAGIGQATVVRKGTDITTVSVMKGVCDALEAADRPADDGVSAEVVDLRSLRPLDVATGISSVEHMARLVCVEEGPKTGGWAAGLVGQVATDALDVLDDVAILSTPDQSIPFSPPLEDAALPGVDAILAAVRERAGIK
jgi:pyruvate/2-oxoglutarate/acetoin dehydrogenase E1 component